MLTYSRYVDVTFLAVNPVDGIYYPDATTDRVASPLLFTACFYAVTYKPFSAN
jgi:hypothetical protein